MMNVRPRFPPAGAAIGSAERRIIRAGSPSTPQLIEKRASFLGFDGFGEDEK
jgi:hypothetical protein